jgi:DNA-binding NarL/FixJ family response regulator
MLNRTQIQATSDQTMNIKKRVVILGLQQSVRELIALKLASVDFLTVVGDAKELPKTLLTAKSSNPDIVILDTDLEGKDLTDAVDALKVKLPKCTVVLFTDARISPKVLAYFRGCSVYISSKHGHITRLIEVLRSMSEEDGADDDSRPTGEPTLRPMKHDGADEPDEHHARLTQREVQILTLIASSHSSKEIANTLGISEHTVSNHRANIMCKLSIKDLAALVRYAIRHGLVDTEA